MQGAEVGVYPPGRKNFENTPPLRIWKKYTPLSAARSAAAIFLAKFGKLMLI